ncbi:RNA-binding motif, single-stranded-interacting protein 3 [Lemmus lemmus]
MWFSFPFLPAPSEPLLCKFADGGQKKRQNQSKYTQNGRPWPREGEAGMALTYDPTAAIQNGFYSSPYSLATNRMIPQTSITPFIAASPVSTYQGAVITPTMDHPMSMQPTNIVGPLTQQMNHLSLGTAGTVSGRVCFCILGLEKVPHAVFTSIAHKLIILHPLQVPARRSLHASSTPGSTHSHGKG